MFQIILVLAMAHAELNSIPSKIERLNRGVKGMQGPKESCVDCGFPAGIEAPPNAWKECFNQICGHNLGSKLKDFEKMLSPARMDPIIAEFRSQIEDAARAELELEAAKIKFVLRETQGDRKIKNPYAVQIGNLLNAVVNTRYISLNANWDADLPSTYESFAAAGLTRADADLSMDLQRTSKGSTLKQPRIFSEHIEYIRQQLSPEQLQAEVKQTVKYISETAQKNNQKLGFSSDALGLPTEEIQQLSHKLSSGNFNNADVKRLAAHYQAAQFYDTVLSNPELLKSAVRQDFKAPALDSAALNARLKEIEMALKNKNPIFGKDSSAAYQCLTAAALGEGLLPSQEDVKRFVKHEEPSIRRKFLDKLKPYLSRQSGQEVDQKLSKALLRPPMGRDEFIADLQQTLKSFAARSRSTAADLNNPKTGGNREAYLAVEIFNRSRGTGFGQNLQATCAAHMPTVLDDGAQMFDGRFQLSGETAANGPDSHAKCNHEYAHMIADMIGQGRNTSEETKAWQDRVHSCLNQGHDLDGLGRQEEDFADLLALSFTGAGAATFCGYIPDNEKSLTLTNWNPKDHDHSGFVYRVLHGRVLSGEGIPQICKDALAEKGEAPFERNCLKETPEAHAAAK